jgi:DNA-binding PadR family transcriptional regulator
MGAGSVREQAAAPMHSPVNWALLGLVIERPSYAYELARRFERTYDGALSLSSVSHIYTALGTLRERRLVEETPDTPDATRSRRRYQATALGLSEHGQWLVGQVAEERRRQHVLIVQLGALARTPQRASAALDAYEQACMAEMAAAPAPGADEGPGTTRLVARLIGEDARGTIAARLRWVQYARAQLQALAPVPAPPPSGAAHPGSE